MSKKPTKKAEIRIDSFGSLTGLIFGEAGYAEVLMTWPEIKRIIEVWKAYEGEKEKPKQEIIDALDILKKHVMNLNLAIKAEVVIAQSRADIVPVIDTQIPSID